MNEVKYHPLINDSETTDMIPMFSAISEKDVTTKFYLAEYVPSYYRLMSKEAVSRKMAYRLHCPCCGKVMKEVSASDGKYKHSLYTCKNCRRKNS